MCVCVYLERVCLRCTLVLVTPCPDNNNNNHNVYMVARERPRFGCTACERSAALDMHYNIYIVYVT